VLCCAVLIYYAVNNSSGLEDIALDELVSIRVSGNPIPFAVGVSLVSWEGIQHNGMRGRAVRIVHIYGDTLCQKWNKNARINEGFSLVRIRPLPGYEEPFASEGGGGIESDMEGLEVGSGSGDEEEEGPGEGEWGGESQAQGGSAATILATDPAKAPGTTPGTTPGPALPETGVHVPEAAVLTEGEMDVLLETCLLRALFYIVKDRHLPLLVSALWSLLLRYVDIVGGGVVVDDGVVVGGSI
jgi:hypothetical protein